MDDYTLAKKIFRSKGQADASALSNNVTTFEALALTDSVNGMVTIDMGGFVTSGNDQQGIEVPTTVVVKKGQTVIVQNSGGSLIVIGVIGGGDELKGDIIFELEKDYTEKIYEAGQQIRDDVNAELAPLEESFNSFKEEQQLTNETFSNNISDAVSNSNAALEASSQATQTVESFKTEVSQKFEDYDLGVIEMNTKIEQTEQNIATEVSNREAAVSGALLEAKSYTDQQADSISQTVQENVENSIGQTYATKSELTQTSEEITATFTGEIQGVKGDIEGVDSKYETMIRLAANGVMVGRSGNYKVLMNASGSFDILDSNEDPIARIYVGTAWNGNEYITATYLRTETESLVLQTLDSGSSVSLDESGVHLSSQYGYTLTPASTNMMVSDYSKLRLVGGCRLYSSSSGSTGTISLNRSLSYMMFVDIIYSDGSRYYTHRVYLPNGKSTSIQRIVNGSGTAYIMSEMLTLSGTTITRGSVQQSNTYYEIIENYTDGVEHLKIYDVIGWR